ncbi:hypothetical protein [Quatrionicoccus australiensis]|uniref:hypothetical protein n=1 Tax=Quatrionicoccus australiensis TaxID=138118 RepID=UPI001CFB36D7|nr:hypothetical protein [Quatrionicoccus australiensis]MCB4360589.1 hypothetical protein [Quatrionicoccus australiensis]
MKRLLLALTLGAAVFSAPATAQVSVSIGQPGFYGRIDIGGFPEPALLFPQPVMIQRVPVGRPPLYLRVPPGHANHWGKYCGRYRACGERVYFVRDDWYSNEYAPRYREQHGHSRQEYRHERRDDRRDYREDRRDDRRDFREDRRDDRRGGGDHGHGKGHGHD